MSMKEDKENEISLLKQSIRDLELQLREFTNIDSNGKYSRCSSCWKLK